jgi:hypothetical protein
LTKMASELTETGPNLIVIGTNLEERVFWAYILNAECRAAM